MNSRIVRRLTWLLFIGQSLTSAAFIASFTVGAIAGALLSGKPALAGLPGATYQLGAALAAYPAARFMERRGRRAGLMLGYVIGIGGALLAAYAILELNFILFLMGFGGMGITKGFTDLARYAAAEMHPPQARGRAISLVVLGGTVGAIGGPALVAPMGRLAESAGANALAGPWVASAGLFLVGLLLIGLLLRPDPSAIGRELARRTTSLPESLPGTPDGPVRPLRAILAQPATRVAVAAMVLGQLVMVMLMAMTSLHMTHHGHGLGTISIVIMAHTIGMFGLSMVTGRLADNFGRAPVIAAGCLLLLAACLLAPISTATGLLAVALFLLGLGWNFCYVAGAALLTDSLSLAERSRMQGSNDLAVGMVSALGSLQSGALYDAIGFASLSWLSLLVALAPLVLAVRLIRSLRAGAPRPTSA
jgi:MFS family permease